MSAKRVVREFTNTHGFNADLHADEFTEGLFDAKVPELCPDCQGRELIPCCWGPECHPKGSPCRLCKPCDHPNAPTIAKLLAIGAAVMTTETRLHHAGGQAVITPEGEVTKSAAYWLWKLREVS
jgi:hypothetical protein